MVVFNENAKTLVEILRSEFVGCNDAGGKDMFPHVTRCALDVICGEFDRPKRLLQRILVDLKAIAKVCS